MPRQDHIQNSNKNLLEYYRYDVRSETSQKYWKIKWRHLPKRGSHYKQMENKREKKIIKSTS